MRELLSHHGVPYEERNVAHDAAARAELEARIGTVLVPTLMRGDETVIGYDPPGLQRLLGDDAAAGAPADTGFDGLPGAGQPGEAERPVGPLAAGDDVAAHLRDFLDHLEHEMRVNAAKGSHAYRHGVHDGLRFAADGLRTILEDKQLPNQGRRALSG